MKNLRIKETIAASRALLCAAAAALLGACTLEPDYEVPETPLNAKVDALKSFKYAKDSWKQANPQDDLPKGKWWLIFNDDNLNKLIETCRANNPNLKSAFYAVENARAKAFMTESELYPWVNGNLAYSRTGTAENSANYRGTYNDYALGLGLTWDLDLFGRVQALLASDTAEAQAMFAAYENVMLMLECETASTYFTILQYNSEIEILSETVKTREAQLEIIKNRFAANYSSKTDLKRAEQQLYEAKSQLAAVETTKNTSANYLAYLIGTIPAKFEAPSANLVFAKLPETPLALPSALLERRPDIAEAERKVYAANYRIGAANSAFFPTVQLTSSVGLDSQKADTLFNSASLAWGVSPNVYIPIFQAGNLWGQRKSALAYHAQVVEDYKATVLNAIYETESALSSIRDLKTEYEARAETAKASMEVRDLTKDQYETGTIDYFEFTDAERLALLNERERINVMGNRFRAVITLVRAIGGSAKDYASAPETQSKVAKD